MSKEQWKAIEGFEGLYEVSSYGRVKSLERIVKNHGGVQKRAERILKENHSSTHSMVVLCKDGKTYPKTVHRLVANAFIPNPDNKPVVDHIDTNPRNNHVENLRWVTVQENCLNSITRKNNSASKKGHPYYGRPLTLEERDKIRQAHTGRKASEETRKKMSDSRKNNPHLMEIAKENIKKAIEANTGKKLSEERKEHMRNKMKGVHKGKRWKIENGKRVWYYPDEKDKE